MSLDTLFEQILKSEQNAEHRHAKIIEVDRQILSYEKQAEDLENFIAEAKLKMRQENLCLLYEEQAEQEVLTKQYDSLLFQRDKLKKNIEEANITLCEASQDKEKKLDKFIGDLDNFTKKFDFVSTEAKNCQKRCVEELQVLQKEEETILLKLNDAKLKRSEFSSMVENKVCLEAELSHLRANIIELDQQLDKKRQSAELKKKEIEAIVQSQQCEPEYCRLQNELQALACKSAKDEIFRLQVELAQLQQMENRR